MIIIWLSDVNKMLLKYGKRVKQGKMNETIACQITAEYLQEKKENEIKSHLEEKLIELLDGVIENM